MPRILTFLHVLQDVRICSAACFCQILRIHAPHTPYASETLADMFAWLLVVLRRLESPSDPLFEISYGTLDLASQVSFAEISKPTQACRFFEGVIQDAEQSS